VKGRSNEPLDSISDWAARNDGFEHTDSGGRTIRFRFSRFHGAIVTVNAGDSEATTYLGDPQPLINYLTERAEADAKRNGSGPT
jgi:hypothetical protein